MKTARMYAVIAFLAAGCAATSPPPPVGPESFHVERTAGNDDQQLLQASLEVQAPLERRLDGARKRRTATAVAVIHDGDASASARNPLAFRPERPSPSTLDRVLTQRSLASPAIEPHALEPVMSAPNVLRESRTFRLTPPSLIER